MNYPMKLQDIFDTVWQRFVVEGQPRCVDTDGTCRYRNDNGQGCFIGVCIPPSVYNPVMEGESVRTLTNAGKTLFGFFDSALLKRIDMPFGEHGAGSYVSASNTLTELQKIHDSYSIATGIPWKEYVEKELRSFAEGHLLTIPGTKAVSVNRQAPSGPETGYFPASTLPTSGDPNNKD